MSHVLRERAIDMLRLRVLTLVRTMLWIGMCHNMFQFLPIPSNFAQPLKRNGPTFHRPQSSLCERDVLCYMRQMADHRSHQIPTFLIHETGGQVEGLLLTNTDLNKCVNKI